MGTPKLRRIVVYVSADDYMHLRSKLLLVNKNASEWFREIIKRFLKD